MPEAALAAQAQTLDQRLVAAFFLALDVVQQTAVVEKQSRKNEVKKASTGMARSNPEGASPKKVYRRRDIIELMNSDPKRYEALMPEIMKAYAEGRVK